MESMLTLGLRAEIRLLTVSSGRDDFICISDGSMSVWHNTPGPSRRQPTVRYLHSSSLPNFLKL